MLVRSEGRDLLLEGEFLRAKRFFKRKLREGDPKLDAYWALELGLVNREQEKRAWLLAPFYRRRSFDYLRRATESIGVTPFANQVFAEALHERGEFESAIEQLDTAIQKYGISLANEDDPGPIPTLAHAAAHCHLMAGFYRAELGRFDRAREDYASGMEVLTRASIADPRSRLAFHQFYATSLLVEQRYTELKDYLEQTVLSDAELMGESSGDVALLESLVGVAAEIIEQDFYVESEKHRDVIAKLYERLASSTTVSDYRALRQDLVGNRIIARLDEQIRFVFDRILEDLRANRLKMEQESRSDQGSREHAEGGFTQEERDVLSPDFLRNIETIRARNRKILESLDKLRDVTLALNAWQIERLEGQRDERYSPSLASRLRWYGLEALRLSVWIVAVVVLLGFLVPSALAGFAPGIALGLLVALGLALMGNRIASRIDEALEPDYKEATRRELASFVSWLGLKYSLAVNLRTAVGEALAPPAEQ